jgi:hypothetical protein
MVYLAALLFATYYRTIKSTFTTSNFLAFQERAIHWLDSEPFARQLRVDSELRSEAIVKFDQGQLATFTQGIEKALLCNRFIYFWAYQIDRYQDSSAAMYLISCHT